MNLTPPSLLSRLKSSFPSGLIEAETDGGGEATLSGSSGSYTRSCLRGNRLLCEDVNHIVAASPGPTQCSQHPDTLRHIENGN